MTRVVGWVTGIGRSRPTASCSGSGRQFELVPVPVPVFVPDFGDGSFAGVQALKTVVPALPVVVVDGAAHGGERGVLRRPEFLSTLRKFLRSNQ